MARAREDRYDIEAIVIESLNSIVRCGGAFKGAYSQTLRRETQQPVKIKVRK
jgi:hypothetical protein